MYNNHSDNMYYNQNEQMNYAVASMYAYNKSLNQVSQLITNAIASITSIFR